jgi:polysaccharide export outer membrane protein
MKTRSPNLLSGCSVLVQKILLGFIAVAGVHAALHAQQAGSAPTAGGSKGAAGAAGGHSSGGAAESVAPEGIADLKLSPGSMVDVHVFEEPDLDGSYRLDSSGDITIPFGGKIPLASLTLPEAEAVISAKLVSAEILKMAHVTVNIDEYNAQNVVVLGEVATPGRYPILGSRKLKDLIAMSGGLTPLAGNEIVVHRASQPSDVTETIHDHGGLKDERAMDVDINPGDSILVKKAGIVYVLGAVTRPGGYVMQEDGELNVAQAVALAGGTTQQASTNKTRIIRKGPDGTILDIATLYNKVTKGEAVPVLLHPQDIVFVPQSGVKATLALLQAEINAAATTSIYTVVK